MADERFKLPGSSYAELVKIIRAYGHAPDEAVPKDVADRAGMDPTQVSRNNGFLVSVGVLSGGNKKSLTSQGRALAQALDFEMPDQIESAWRNVSLEDDFMKKIVSAVRIRGGMDLAALRNHVAYTAGQPKSPRILTGAGSVVDVLKVAGLLLDEDGKIVARTDGEPRKEPPHASTPDIPHPPVAQVRADSALLSGSAMAAGLSIEVRVDCKPEDLESLGPKLRALLTSLSAPENGDLESE